jgi:hypothetical protein
MTNAAPQQIIVFIFSDKKRTAPVPIQDRQKEIAQSSAGRCKFLPAVCSAFESCG